VVREMKDTTMYWYNCRKFIIQALICGALPCAANVVFASDHDKFDSDDRSIARDAVPSQKPRTPPFTGFARYKRSFDRICDLLRADGRVEAFYTLLDRNSLRDDDCPACRPLIISFTGSCRKMIKKSRPPKPKKLEEGEEAVQPSPAPKLIHQRDPSTELINDVCRLFIAFSEDQKIRGLVLPATMKVVTLLRSPQDKSPGARDYFTTLAAFMEAPFLELKAAQERADKSDAEGGSHKFEKTGPAVDEMFDF
jgi:hypothetical protein